MGTPNRIAAPARAKESAGNMIFVGIICLAVGSGIGYYFGKTVGSTAMPTASTPAQTQATIMDPATFLKDEASFKSMINSNPKDLNALVQLGNLYYDNSKFSEAVLWYGKALDIDPNNIGVRTDRGSCYWSLGEADAAIGEFQKSLQLNPTHAQTLYNLGIVYLHGKNDLAEARKAWEKLLATSPDFPDRARIQQMLTSLAAPAPAENPAAPSPGSEKTGQNKAGTSSMEDLFKRMKK